ncbi:MAG: hypothetical protein IJU41_02425 [Clostridia bacterium]|nr:hypothetical protein [Clostridia bacterium]
MKKAFLTFLCLALLCALCACVNRPAETAAQTTAKAETTESAAPRLTAIVDRTADGSIATAEALEPFWEENGCTYSFPSIKSEYVECIFSDGSVMKFTDALRAGKVVVPDLAAYGILYWVEDESGKISSGFDLKN